MDKFCPFLTTLRPKIAKSDQKWLQFGLTHKPRKIRRILIISKNIQLFCKYSTILLKIFAIFFTVGYDNSSSQDFFGRKIAKHG